MKKIVVYGGNGWIGNQFCEILEKNNKDYIKLNSRIDNYCDILNDVQKNKPTHIISFAGRTHGVIDGKSYPTIDYLEQKGKLRENIRDNLFGPILLANICTKYHIHFTYIGTGCIFKYDDDHPYEKEENGFKEQDPPNFFGSSYSTVKGFTDQLLFLNHSNICLNLRIRMPITDKIHPRNFITKVTTYEKICSIKNSMSVLPDLLPIVLDMMEKWTLGTINLTNPGLISHNDILEMYKQIVDKDFKWENFTTEEQNKILACDRSNNYLDTSRLEYLYPNIKNIKESIRNILKKYKTQIHKINVKL